MNVILGFGSVEVIEQERIKAALIAGALHELPPEEIVKEWNDRADRYDLLSREEVPARYTRVWCYDLPRSLKFLHVNRRHPFSPDGWAALNVEVKL